MKRALAAAACAAALVLAALAGARALWRVPFASRVPTSIAVTDAHGRLLRLTVASDDKYRLWTPLAAMPPQLVEAVVLKEDRWFRWHPGVNPVAILRGAWRTYAQGDRQGGSTLTMQLARIEGRRSTRTIAGKIAQAARALALEALYSKDEILEAYLNLVPYGGNVEGVGAASLIYFSKPARELTTPEVLTLAVIPQSPARRGLAGPDPASLARSRAVLFGEWAARHAEDRRYAELVAAPLKLRTPRELPFAAPHLTTQLLAERVPGSPRTIASTVDLGLQRTLERRVREYVKRESPLGIANAAAILVDTRDMAVKALVGSADFFDDAIDGQVNGAEASRSPGSTLKPFVYGLALDQGLIHPDSILRDAPTSFGPFSPENFDGAFAGPIAAKDALIRSRNVPAVALAANLSQPSLYDFLKSAGVARLRPERYYGLALALGGGEVTMEELARLYATLANRGVEKPLRYRLDDPLPEGLRLLSPEAAFVTLDMLRDNPRPDSSTAERLRRIAWKTGTSWAFRDAWTAGIAGPYVLVVWIGNFGGEGNPAFVGVRAAAPLFFEITDALDAEGRLGPEVFTRPPAGLARVEVCAASGDLPNAWCPKRDTTWFIPGKSPIRVSTLHRAVPVDPATGKVACTAAQMKRAHLEVFEYWPSDIQRLFREAGLPRREPPVDDCADPNAADRDGARPRILSPLTGAAYVLRLDEAKPPPIALTASLDAGAREVYWFAGESYLGAAGAGAPLPWTPASAGRYLIRAIDDHGRSDSREVRVDAER